MFITVRIPVRKFLTVLTAAVVLAVAVPVIVVATTNEREKVAYLTFDDGPSEVTPRLLETLKKKGVRATFFITGQYEYAFPFLKQIVDDGHLLALHSYTHKFSVIYDSTDNFWSDIGQLEALVLDVTGKPAAKILRFPGGSSNTVSYKYGGSGIMDELVAQAAEKGYTYFDWTVDTRDAVDGTLSADTIASRALKGAKETHKPAVILMHDGPTQKTAPEAVSLLIDRFTAEGWRFDTLDHIAEEVHHTMP